MGRLTYPDEPLAGIEATTEFVIYREGALPDDGDGANVRHVPEPCTNGEPSDE